LELGLEVWWRNTQRNTEARTQLFQLSHDAVVAISTHSAGGLEKSEKPTINTRLYSWLPVGDARGAFGKEAVHHALRGKMSHDRKYLSSKQANLGQLQFVLDRKVQKVGV
jgi:hypothetical protein